MLELIGMQELRPGADPNAVESSGRDPNCDEAKANVYLDWPELLRMRDGREISTQTPWWLMRRPDLAEIFETEIVGEIPENRPGLSWNEVDRSVGDNTTAGMKTDQACNTL